MNQSKPVLINASGLRPSDGITRQKFVDNEGRWLGWADLVHNKAGYVSDWHCHPSSETYVYVMRGSLTVNFGIDGRESAVARAGDFLLIPSGTVHQEMTSRESDLEAFVIRVGCEPEKIVVERP